VFTATDEQGAHQICVFAYENLHIVRVDKLSQIPMSIQRLAISPVKGGPLFKRFSEDMTIPTPVIIQGLSIDISTGPLIERHAMIANLHNSYNGLSDASISFTFADTRGPPHAYVDHSLVYINEKGEIAGPLARLVFVVGDIKNVKFPELRDDSKLDLTIFDSPDGGRGKKGDDVMLNLEVSYAEFSRYYSEVYEWNKVAQAHGLETLPIDPMYVSRDIRKGIGQETPEDKEQEMKEEFKRSAERETRARERALP
jgi:hypothetical protein